MLTSIAQIKAEGNLPDSIDDELLQPHLVKAAILVKKIITAEKYLEIEAFEHDDESFISCSIAEANLALFYAWPSLNIETQGTGIVKIKGWDQSRSELKSQDEIIQLQEHNRNVAMDLLKPFIPQNISAGEVTSDTIKGGNYFLSGL